MVLQNELLIELVKEKEQVMAQMRELIKKKDINIDSQKQKDMTLQIMNIKIEEMNAFFLQMLKKLNRQYEAEREVHRKQFAAIGDYVKDSFIKDANMSVLRLDTSTRGSLLPGRPQARPREKKTPRSTSWETCSSPSGKSSPRTCQKPSASSTSSPQTRSGPSGRKKRPRAPSTSRSTKCRSRTLVSRRLLQRQGSKKFMAANNSVRLVRTNTAVKLHRSPEPFSKRISGLPLDLDKALSLTDKE